MKAITYVIILRAEFRVFFLSTSGLSYRWIHRQFNINDSDIQISY